MIVPTGPPAFGRRRNRHQDRVPQATREVPLHPSNQKTREFPPPVVLEGVNQSGGRRVQNHRRAGGDQRRIPTNTFRTGLPGGMACAQGKRTPLAKRGCRRPEPAATSNTNQALWILGRDPLSASETAPWEKKVDQVSGQGADSQRARTFWRADLITSREGFFLHHRSNATAPWCKSISDPSAARIPRSRAEVTKGVVPAS